MKIILPWPPKELNPNFRGHWTKLSKIKKAYREDCAWQAIQQGAKPIKADSLHLTITFYAPDKRGRDLDNMLSSVKNLLDGLADVLKVDDKHWTLTIRKGETVGGFVEVEIV